MKNSKVTIETARKIAGEIYTATYGLKKIEKREEIVKKIMADKFPEIEYKFIGEKCHAGRNGAAKVARGGFRINYRCGYSKHNYAPCILVQA